jgi:hypothetical protein
MSFALNYLIKPVGNHLLNKTVNESQQFGNKIFGATTKNTIDDKINRALGAVSNKVSHWDDVELSANRNRTALHLGTRVDKNGDRMKRPIKNAHMTPYTSSGAWNPNMSAPTATQKASIDRSMKFDKMRKSFGNKASSAWRGTKNMSSSMWNGAKNIFSRLFRKGRGRSQRKQRGKRLRGKFYK